MGWVIRSIGEKSKEKEFIVAPSSSSRGQVYLTAGSRIGFLLRNTFAKTYTLLRPGLSKF